MGRDFAVAGSQVNQRSFVLSPSKTIQTNASVLQKLVELIVGNDKHGASIEVSVDVGFAEKWTHDKTG